MPAEIQFPPERVLAEGWVVSDLAAVTPSDVEPMGTVYISARFVNQASWLPAYAVMQIRLDGAVIWERAVLFGPGEEYTKDFTYVLPSSVSSGIHVVTSQEQEQASGIPRTEFTVTAPAPPGQRNLSVSSIPAGAEIYVGAALYGTAPVTIPLAYGTYEVTAIYGGVTQRRNIQVVSGTGSQAVQFVFEQTQPIDWKKWVTYGAVGSGVLGLIYFIIKKPETVKRGYEVGKKYAAAGYEKARGAYEKYKER